MSVIGSMQRHCLDLIEQMDMAADADADEAVASYAKQILEVEATIKAWRARQREHEELDRQCKAYAKLQASPRIPADPVESA